ATFHRQKQRLPPRLSVLPRLRSTRASFHTASLAKAGGWLRVPKRGREDLLELAPGFAGLEDAVAGAFLLGVFGFGLEHKAAEPESDHESGQVERVLLAFVKGQGGGEGEAVGAES